MKEASPWDDPSAKSQLARIVDEYLQRLDRGEGPQVEDFARRYPTLATPLREVLPRLKAPQSAAGDEPVTGCLGDFRIEREVGRGGMGVVYEAVQISLGRRVALKVLPFAATLDPRQLQRFKNEAQAAASLHHTNIVPVYAVGCERGVHFYAMQFIEGKTLAALVRDLRREAGLDATPRPIFGEQPTVPCGPFSPLPEVVAPETKKKTRQAASTARLCQGPDYFRTVARLGMQAAEALEHAHGFGIVHRDVKPGNLLLDVNGSLWVTDFGLARCRGEDGLTVTGEFIGTLRYVSPEQALGGRTEVDHRADVYALGATLYELLTLEHVFDGRDREELLRQVASEEPTPPRRLNRAVPADLETIALKALEKNPADRYQTAQELADDLRRFLEDKPVRARRPTVLQKVHKWSRRHRLEVRAMLTAVLLTLTGLGVAAVLVQQERANTAEVRAELEARARREQELLSYYQAIGWAERERAAGNVGRAELLLDRQCPEPLRGWEWHYLKRQRYGNPAPLTHAAHLYGMAQSIDGHLLATGASDGTVTLWDARTGEKVREILSAHDGQVRGVAFSPDSRRLASVGWDGAVRIWDVATGERLFNRTHGKGALTVAFSPDGQRLVSGGDPGLILWDASTGKTITTLTGHADVVRRVTFSPDGKRLASASSDKTVRLWDADTGRELLVFRRHAHPVFDVAFSPDGTRLASVGGQFFMHGDEGEIKIWNAADGEEIRSLHGHSGAVFCVAFSPDGRRLVTGGDDPDVRTWDAESGHEALTLRGHREAVWAVAFSSDGHRVLSASGDHTVRVWDGTPLDRRAGAEWRTLHGHAARVTAVKFSPDGKRVVSASMDHTARVWDVASGRELHVLGDHRSPVHGLAFNPDGTQLASASWSTGKGPGETPGTVRLWDARSWKELRRVAVPGSGALDVAFSADGRLLATAGHEVILWDAANGMALRSLSGHRSLATCTVFDPSGTRLVSADSDGTVIVWEAAPRIAAEQALAILLPSPRSFGLVEAWEAAGRPVRTIHAHAGRVFDVAFSPDGRRLASAGVDGVIRLWDTATWDELAAPPRHEGGAHGVAFSPDGRRLLSSGNDAIVRIWDVTTGQEVQALRGHADTVFGVAFSSDGAKMASGGKDREVKLWDAEPPGENNRGKR
jgi:eukaryotic-like serine/threonine-protein kinase